MQKRFRPSNSPEYEPETDIPWPLPSSAGIKHADTSAIVSGSDPEGDTDSSDISMVDCFFEDCDFQADNITAVCHHVHSKHPDYRYQCDFCTSTFELFDSLRKHLRHHEGHKHSCAQCKKSFHEKHELEAHSALHTSKFPYTCEQCGRGFSTNRSFKRHADVHKKSKDIPCTDCSKKI